MEERRQHTRFRKSYIVNFSLKDSPQKSHDISKTLDISKGGLSFFTPEAYPKGTIFTLKVSFPFSGTVLMEGEVVHAQKLAPNNVYKIGARFVNLSAEATMALEQIERINSEKRPPQESRKHPRFEKKFMFVFFLKEKLDGIHTLTWFQDISRGGLKFFSLEFYPVGTILVFNIQFPSLYPQIVAIEGEVLECEEVLAGKTFRIRIQFVNLGAEAVSALENIEKEN